MSKPRLIWVGDAGCASGFERSTRYCVAALEEHFEVHVLGINYYGDPNFVDNEVKPWPYTLWPCYPGGDFFGVKRLPELIERLKPSCIVIQNDPWNFQQYLAKTKDIPTIGIVAVDGKNCRGTDLNGLKLAIFWTAFGEQQARLGGYTGKSAVIPLGVDLSIYKPYNKIQIRDALKGVREVLDQKGMDLEVFIVGVVGRNQPRKRLDLTMSYFADWLHDGTPVERRSKMTLKQRNALLWMHVAPTGEQAYDLEQMANYLGIGDQVLLADVPIFGGVTEKTLAAVYNVFDIGLTTTQGEGFGLTTFEMMACGTPSIVPDWSALGELVGSACVTIPCTTTAATDRTINVIGGIADREETVLALDRLYHNKAWREELARKSIALVQHPRYRWENIGAGVSAEIRLVMQTLEKEAVA